MAVPQHEPTIDRTLSRNQSLYKLYRLFLLNGVLRKMRLLLTPFHDNDARVFPGFANGFVFLQVCLLFVVRHYGVVVFYTQVCPQSRGHLGQLCRHAGQCVDLCPLRRGHFFISREMRHDAVA